MRCRVCDSEIKSFFDLGLMSLVNSFLKKEELQGEKKYPLAVAFCPNCYLVQLTETVPPEELFGHYLYFSSVSSSFLEHCKKTAEYLARRLSLKNEHLVLEIASNDGAMLQYFKALGIKILGVDPAKNIAEEANKRGIKTMPEFFNFKFAQKIAAGGTKADLIYGANVLAHVPEIVDFVKGVSVALKPEGTAVFEFPYLKGLFEKKFDTIYHEHVFYYSLIAIKNLFARADMEIYDVEQIPVQGGSLRIFAAKKGEFPVLSSVHTLEGDEIKSGFNSIGAYHDVGVRVEGLKKELVSLLKDLKSKNKTVAAYSAPAKGNILLNYFGIKDDLSFIVDKSQAKQGLFTPGTHMQVYPVEKIYEDKPDYLLILCWNIYEEVVGQMEKYRKAGGKFIIPVPEIKII